MYTSKYRNRSNSRKNSNSNFVVNQTNSINLGSNFDDKSFISKKSDNEITDKNLILNDIDNIDFNSNKSQY